MWLWQNSSASNICILKHVPKRQSLPFFLKAVLVESESKRVSQKSFRIPGKGTQGVQWITRWNIFASSGGVETFSTMSTRSFTVWRRLILIHGLKYRRQVSLVTKHVNFIRQGADEVDSRRGHSWAENSWFFYLEKFRANSPEIGRQNYEKALLQWAWTEVVSDNEFLKHRRNFLKITVQKLQVQIARQNASLNTHEILFSNDIKMTSPYDTAKPQNRDEPEVRLSVGTFEVDVLAHVASRISSSPSIRHPG